MELKNRTQLIRYYSKALKSNFWKIGNELKQIRGQGLYKEEYGSFKEYLEESKFQFTRQYAYNMIDVFEKNVKSFDKLSISQWIQLTHVSDKQVREELASKATEMTTKQLGDEVKRVNTEKLYSSIHRKSQREDSDIQQGDSKLEKGKRIGNNILNDLESMKSPLMQMKSRIENWIKDFSEYSNELDTLKSAILQKNIELKGI